VKPDTCCTDATFPVMALDILNTMLSRADTPGDLGSYLTEKVCELTGAQCVLLIQCLCTPSVAAHHVISVSPQQRRPWAESRAGKFLYESVHQMPEDQQWHGEETSETARFLQQEGFELSMVFPLTAGAFRVGAMLVLGLPDKEHITALFSLFTNLSTIMALALRNAVLYEKQEQCIHERTAELRDSNEKLALEQEALLRLNEELEQRVCERTKELERRNHELEQMNKAFVGRELRMVELKKRIEALQEQELQK